MSGAKWIRNLFNNSTLPSKACRLAPRIPRSSVRPRLEPLEDRSVPSTLTVTSAANGGAGSLRAAITAANQMTGLVTIDFAIGAAGSTRTINLTSPLPAITGTVVIDGSTQGGSSYTGSPLIVLDGARAGGNACGLVLTGNNSTIDGLMITGFAQDGILLKGNATGNTIGGTTAGMGNVISGNHNDGVEIVGSGAMDNLVEGNLIGTNPKGIGADANRFDGVLLRTGASNNTIGGTTSGAGNLISANNNDGVEIVNTGTSGNLVEGNLIGTNLGGTSTLGNRFDGVIIRTGATGNTVGGTVSGEGNVISGNRNDGIEIVNVGTSGNLVEGNFIGTNLGGTAAVANKFDGILIRTGTTANTIGGVTATAGSTGATAAAGGAGNIISGNGKDGIEIVASGTTANLVEGNLIGTQADGISALGNHGEGVAVRNIASRNTIGGVETGAGNVIAYNGGDGVLIGDTVRGVSAGASNAIEGNSIFANTRLGIFLGYDNTSKPPVVLINNSKGHPGVNNSYQNYPVLNTPQVASDSTVLLGTISSPNNPNSTIRIEFFSSTSADPTRYGQGETFLGAVTVTTDGSGKASFSLTLTTPLAGGTVVSATATDGDGNTSEFSEDVTVP